MIRLSVRLGSGEFSDSEPGELTVPEYRVLPSLQRLDGVRETVVKSGTARAAVARPACKAADRSVADIIPDRDGSAD